MMSHVGIDVSKSKLDICLLIFGINGKRKTKSLPNNAQSAQQIIGWLKAQKCEIEQTHVVLEATGVYHEQLLFALYDAGIKVSLANPARVRSFAQGMDILTKNDHMDAYVLACYSELKQPELWSAPSEEVRVLKGLLHHRDALRDDVLRMNNRLEKAHATPNTPAEVLDSLGKVSRQLKDELLRIEKLVNNHIDTHPGLKNDMDLLTSINAVGPQLGANMLVVLRSSHFDNAGQVAAYLGVIPVERQSGTSVRGKPGLSKAGSSAMRAKLYMSALTAIRLNPHVKAHYEQLLEKGKCKMSALGAAMRKLVHICYGVLKTQQKYDASYAMGC
jgi:transposase